jgi:hypothetical protein
MNVVFWVGVKSTDTNTSDKHGNFKYFEYSKQTWEYWCKKNGVVFYEYNKTSLEDTGTHKVTWQRWFDLEKELSHLDWNKVAVVDASYMVRWNSPNFFEAVSDKLNCFQALENINWMDQGIRGYQSLFPQVSFDLKRYIDCGFQIFTKDHLPFLAKLKQFYFDNTEKVLILQKEVSRGTDQPVYNYLLQQDGIEFEFTLPNSFNMNHMNRFNLFAHNWQLNEDTTPYFLKYGNLWKFSGFDRKQRNELMQQTWNLIKHMYV